MTEADRPTPRTNTDASENGHFGEDRVREPNSADYVTEEVKAEVSSLKESGVDVEIVHGYMKGHFELEPEKQRAVDEAIEVYSQDSAFASKLAEVNPAVAAWYAMAKAKSALALNYFYRMGKMERPSDGLSLEAILHGKLPVRGGMSAVEILRSTAPVAQVEATVQRLKDFFGAGSFKEGVDEFGLTADELINGSLDGKGDVTRAEAMIAMVEGHIANYPEEDRDRGIVTASLASGAAEPMFWLIKKLRAAGKKVDEINLVDIDPIALAASLDRSKEYDLEDDITIHHQDLLGTPVDSYIEPHSADIVEVIGLFEYLPQFKSRPIAGDLLKNAATIVRPGGLLVLGNMLKSRPQQKWFAGLWPKLQQRSINEVIEIIEEAGFSRDQLRIQVPSEGVYAVYAIEIPRETKDTTEVTRQLGRVASPQAA